MGIETELVKQIMMFSTKTEDTNYYTEMALLIESLAYSLGNDSIRKKIPKLTTNIRVKCAKRGIEFINEEFDTLNEVEQLYYKYENLKQVEKSAKVKNILVGIDKQLRFLFIDLAKDDRVSDVMIFPTVQEDIKPLEVL